MLVPVNDTFCNTTGNGKQNEFASHEQLNELIRFKALFSVSGRTCMHKQLAFFSQIYEYLIVPKHVINNTSRGEVYQCIASSPDITFMIYIYCWLIFNLYFNCIMSRSGLSVHYNIFFYFKTAIVNWILQNEDLLLYGHFL